jgi:hypothetical protein
LHFAYQFRLREGIAVADAQSHQPFAVELAPEAVAQPLGVAPLHDDDQIGPVNLVGAQRIVGIAADAAEIGGDAGAPGEYLRRRGAAGAGLAADEQDPGHRRFRMVMLVGRA